MKGRQNVFTVADSERFKLLEACEEFKMAMFKELCHKMNLGYHDWNNKEDRGQIGKKPKARIQQGFKDDENIIAVANLLMFIWFQRRHDAS